MSARLPNSFVAMKKIMSVLVLVLASSLVLQASDQETVDNAASVIRDFRHMPEKGIPRSVLRNARGVAIMSVVKAGFIFSGKAGKGVVVARTRQGCSGPSFIAT